MNFLIVNGGVILPQYGDANDALAVQQVQAMFPRPPRGRRADCARSRSAAATSTASRSSSPRRSTGDAMARIVIALGGNALGNTPAEQRERVAAACPALVGLIHQGHEIIISHGNGPQVGMIQAAFDTAAKTNPRRAPMPLPECTAMSQGYIGYHLQQGMRRTLRASGMPWQVATVVTQVVVDPDDPAFDEPTKPIGAFYDEAAARQMMRDDRPCACGRTPAAAGGASLPRRSRWTSPSGARS